MAYGGVWGSILGLGCFRGICGLLIGFVVGYVDRPLSISTIILDMFSSCIEMIFLAFALYSINYFFVFPFSK